MRVKFHPSRDPLFEGCFFCQQTNKITFGRYDLTVARNTEIATYVFRTCEDCNKAAHNACHRVKSIVSEK